MSLLLEATLEATMTQQKMSLLLEATMQEALTVLMETMQTVLVGLQFDSGVDPRTRRTSVHVVSIEKVVINAYLQACMLAEKVTDLSCLRNHLAQPRRLIPDCPPTAGIGGCITDHRHSRLFPCRSCTAPQVLLRR